MVTILTFWWEYVLSVTGSLSNRMCTNMSVLLFCFGSNTEISFVQCIYLCLFVETNLRFYALSTSDYEV